MSYYENSQWPSGQGGWDHQTPPARSGASSAVPREESSAFGHQIEEVDRAIENLVKSGKMFGPPGRFGRGSGGGPGARQNHNHNHNHNHSQNHSQSQNQHQNQNQNQMGDFNESRGGHPPSNLQHYYANQRHQSSRGSNEAEQMMQAKRRMAAQRERELRNYHQEQQFNRTVLADNTYPGKPERNLSPGGGMSEEERRDLIARQRSALYGEGSFAETGGYVDETGTPRPGAPGSNAAAPGLRGHSPLAYEYGRPPPADGNQGGNESGTGSQSAGPNQRSRANSTSSPLSNQAANKGAFDAPGAQPSSRTSTSSPGGSPGNKTGISGNNTVAPIGTRPSGTSGPAGTPINPALNKQSTTPLPSPLSHGYSAPGNNETGTPTSSTPSSRAPGSQEAPVGLSGWGNQSGVWGSSKSGLGVQASVWG